MFCLWGRNFWGRLCSRTWRSMLMSLVMPVLQWRPFYPILYFKHCFLVKLGDLHSTLIYTWNAYIIIYIYRMHQIVSLHFIIVIVIRQLPITFGRLPWPSRQVMMSYGWLAKSLPGPCPVTSKLLSRAETCRPNQRRRQRPLQNLVQMAQCR